MKRKENDLKQTFQGIMFHVNLQGCNASSPEAFGFYMTSGQIIETSHDLNPNGGLATEIHRKSHYFREI